MMMRQRTWLDDDDGLRYYQTEALGAINAGFKDDDSLLLVMATGLGKTQVFSALARDWDGTVLVLAHRDELVVQARDRLEQMTGEFVEVEQADFKSYRARIVVGSVQSVCQPRRLERLGQDRFSLVIVDEAHHATAATYRRVLDHFRAKRLGVTATPNRADSMALGKVFDSVAYVMDIEDGINTGFLVPVKGRTVQIKEVDLRGIKVTAGDFAKGALDEAMVKAAEGIVHQALHLEPGRQGIFFWPGVKSAELAHHVNERMKPNTSCFLSGDTDTDERRNTIRAYKEGRYQHMHACMVPTEGFDAPTASLIVLGRPTKSTPLFTQMIGRGTRTLPGLVDHLPWKEQSAERQALIAGSTKPDCMVLDCAGNFGNHEPVSAVDALGGNYSEAEVKLAKQKSKASPTADQLELLKQARLELAEIARRNQVRSVQAQVGAVISPFGIIGGKDTTSKYTQRFGAKAMSTAQVDMLKKWGVKESELSSLNRKSASSLISQLIARRNSRLASYSQMAVLRRYGITDPNITMERASAAMDYLKAKGYQPDPVKLSEILYYQRQAGE